MKHPSLSARALLLALALPVAGIVLLGGCAAKADGTSGDGDLTTTQEQGATASNALGMLMDASSEAALSSTTSGGTAAAARAGAGEGPAEPAPDFAGLRGVTTIDLATFQVNGQPLFPPGTTATGTLTITTSGSAATSWPTGSTVLFDGLLSVALSNVVITNLNGDTLTLASGTYTQTFTANSTKTDDFNWDVTTHAEATVSPVLSATVVHGSHSGTLTMGGNRTVDATIQRRKSASGVTPVVNKRTAVRTISGTVAGNTLTSNAALAAHNYTAWTVTLNSFPVKWNRFATVTTVYDYKPAGTTFSVSAAEDDTYVTVGGVQTGPKTVVEWGAILHAKIASEYL